MTSSEIAARLRVTSETVRQWSARFEAHLSAGATPTESRAQRRYNEDDAAVLAYVAQQRAEGLTFEAIEEQLTEGARGELPEEEAREEQGWGAAELPPVPVLVVQLRGAQIELQHTAAERDRLRDELRETQQRERDALERAARAEGKLEVYEALSTPQAPLQRTTDGKAGASGDTPAPVEERPHRSLWVRLFGRES